MYNRLNSLLPVYDCPDDKYLGKYVKEKVCGAGKWRELGMELMGQDAISALYVISINHPTDVEKCCLLMFTKWKERTPKANWKQLLNVLKEIQLVQLASELEGLLISSVTDCERKVEKHQPHLKGNFFS